MFVAVSRHRCSACYKQFKKKEHLIHHLSDSFHSIHQPKCGVCKKHCKSFESLREHLLGRLPKADCMKIFRTHGCDICLNVFDNPNDLNGHRDTCRLTPTVPLEPVKMLCMDYEMEKTEFVETGCTHVPAVAMDCEFVGGGSDGTFDICARVCLIDEDENVIFHTYVQPYTTITNYRYEITGITKEHLEDAMTLKQVQDKIMEILYNGESIWRARSKGGKARRLVGHSLKHDLSGLGINYPDYTLRDTARYQPLMKTNFVSHSLKYLTKTYLGYDIQQGVHCPYEDCVAAMRLYKRMRSQVHLTEEEIDTSNFTKSNHRTNIFDSLSAEDLMDMSPDALLDISRPTYRCWCLDLIDELNDFERATSPMNTGFPANVQSVGFAARWLSVAEENISEEDKIDMDEHSSWNVPDDNQSSHSSWNVPVDNYSAHGSWNVPVDNHSTRVAW
ncbi:hypothetical protein GIB67_041455 [Kingdonia uniflora]|uniref:RNA exonuclease 4 n=1 Tax=Kingdonia uniflora TaxID=39325 RepID=A0A7J7LRT5_9MAGN|nr:hypothetical protein GIB67_041455 [Kingdonia uniflora]